MMSASDSPAPSRRVVQADALSFMDEHPLADGASVITSLPDMSEFPELDAAAWRAWFIEAARRVIRWAPPRGVAIFYQSDVRHQGVWIDKGYLVLRAAEEERASLVWHKIVCRSPVGTATFGRATYSHLICVAHEPRPTERRPSPDVLPSAGAAAWSRGMGTEACAVACRYVKDEVGATLVVNPFCGRGTVLAVANALGLDSLGVEKSGKRCRAARAAKVTPELLLRRPAPRMA